MTISCTGWALLSWGRTASIGPALPRPRGPGTSAQGPVAGRIPASDQGVGAQSGSVQPGRSARHQGRACTSAEVVGAVRPREADPTPPVRPVDAPAEARVCRANHRAYGRSRTRTWDLFLIREAL